jgi:non-specific protein-tyrosine kinase
MGTRTNKGADKQKGLFEDVYKKIKITDNVKELPREPEIQEDFTLEEKEKAGWTSPNYSKSRTVKLNMSTLANNRCVAIFPYARETDVYKVLRTQILRLTKEKGGNTIMITSALPGEGKTLTAINLSFTFAKLFDQTVLLVDGDLRRQGIHKLLGFESDRGLADYLVDKRPVSDIITWPGIDKLTVISGGKSIQESTELLGTSRMIDLVREMKTRYPDRYVFFDVPSVLSRADTLAFVPLVDYIIIVVRAGTTPMDDVRKALELIPQEKVLGFVLNRYKTQPTVYTPRV